MTLSGDDRTAVALSAVVGALAGAFLGMQAGSLAMALILAGLAGSIAAVVAHAARKAAARRREAFGEVARANGWRHEHGLSGTDVAGLAAFRPFRRGHTTRCAQRLTGQRGGVAFQLADASYVTGSGKNRQVHRVGAAMVRMPFDFALTIEAEGLGHKLVDALGGEDIDVESDEFSRRFWVQSPDRRMAYDVLHARAIEWLLAAGTRWTWHWNGPWLVLSRPGTLEPAEAVPLLEMALGFRALLPRHLVAAHAPPRVPVPDASLWER